MITGKKEAALAYAEQLNVAVIPLFGIDENKQCRCGKKNCKSPGKHPHRGCVIDGLNSATKDLTLIEAWWNAFPDCNIGVRTGEISGCWAVDVDCKKGRDGEGALDALITRYGALPDTVEAITPTGGRHLVFRQNGAQIKTENNGVSLGDGLDVRGEGGYIAVWPSETPDGAYEWEASSDPFEGARMADAPQWLTDKVKKTNGVALPDPDEKDDIDGIDADNALAKFVGHRINEGDDRNSIWEACIEWNNGLASPMPEKRIRKTMRSIIKKHENEKETTLPQQHPTVETLMPLPEPDRRAPFPEELYELPGVAGEIREWIMRTAMSPQPIFATGAAIMACAVAMGRRYVSATGLRTNTYLCDVGPTGSGKEHTRKCLKAIFMAAGRSDFLGAEDVRSGKAITSRAQVDPNVLFLIDEFGLVLQSAQAKGNHAKAEIFSNLMTLTSAAQSVYLGSEYADQDKKKAQHIEYPCVHVYGSTTAEMLYAAFNASHMSNGFANRILFLKTETPLPNTNHKAVTEEVPVSIVDWVKLVTGAVSREDTGNLEGFNPATPLTVAEDDNTRDLLLEYDAWIRTKRINMMLCEPGSEALWARAKEQAIRTAITLAVAEDPEACIVRYNHLYLAILFVNHCTEWMVAKSRDHVADSDDGALLKKCLDVIRKARKAKNGPYHEVTSKGYIPRRVILKNMNMRAYLVDQLLETLQSSGRIAEKSATNKNRTVKCFYLLESE